MARPLVARIGEAGWIEAERDSALAEHDALRARLGVLDASRAAHHPRRAAAYRRGDRCKMVAILEKAIR